MEIEDEEIEFENYYVTLGDLKKLVQKIEKDAVAEGIPVAHVDNLVLRDSFYRPIKKLVCRVSTHDKEHKKIEDNKFLSNHDRRELYSRLWQGDSWQDYIAVFNFVIERYGCATEWED